MVSRCVLLLTSIPWLSSLRGKPRETALCFFSIVVLKSKVCVSGCFQAFLSLTMEDMPKKTNKQKKTLVKLIFVGVVDLSYAKQKMDTF